jgi:hypothetical protein
MGDGKTTDDTECIERKEESKTSEKGEMREKIVYGAWHAMPLPIMKQD